MIFIAQLFFISVASLYLNNRISFNIIIFLIDYKSESLTFKAFSKASIGVLPIA